MKNIILLGSTGSIGKSACNVIENFPNKFRIVGMAAGNNIDLFEKQIRKFRPSIVSMQSQEKTKELKERLGNPKGITFVSGESGNCDVAAYPDGSIVIVAIVGKAGLMPTISAIENGKDIALANKETMVMAGKIITEKAKEAGINIIPVDSEHSAIFQCLHDNKTEWVEKIILTASGGALRGLSQEELENVTPSQALSHPNWKMGNKVTIDSATLMNKGLEVIEAYWLFNCDVDKIKIDVVIHPQSIVHSMVQYIDGSVLAQMSLPDMKLPILYAIGYPNRIKYKIKRLNLCESGCLSFEQPDRKKFPCLELAYSALKAGNGAAVVLNAVNDIAVKNFLSCKIGFTRIYELIDETINDYVPQKITAIEDVLEIDGWARRTANSKIQEIRN